MTTIFIGFPGTQEIILLALVCLLLFGGKKIPELMKGIGKGINEFRKAKDEAVTPDDLKEKKV